MMLSVDQIIKSIAQLPAAEQERIRQWLEEKRATNREAQGSQAHVNRSARSLRWLHENRVKYSGQWVALDGDRLMASGPTAKELYCKAKAEGIEIPFVELVTDSEPVPSTGGWLS
jgi:Family of unknown function (DUF5678)